MSKLQRPCPGCPTLTWVLEGAATCSDCGCTLEAYQEVEQRSSELLIAARALPSRLRALVLPALASISRADLPKLTRSELQALVRFQGALGQLWMFDEDS